MVGRMLKLFLLLFVLLIPNVTTQDDEQTMLKLAGNGGLLFSQSFDTIQKFLLSGKKFDGATEYKGVEDFAMSIYQAFEGLDDMSELFSIYLNKLPTGNNRYMLKDFFFSQLTWHGWNGIDIWNAIIHETLDKGVLNRALWDYHMGERQWLHYVTNVFMLFSEEINDKNRKDFLATCNEILVQDKSLAWINKKDQDMRLLETIYSNMDHNMTRLATLYALITMDLLAAGYVSHACYGLLRPNDDSETRMKMAVNTSDILQNVSVHMVVFEVRLKNGFLEPARQEAKDMVEKYKNQSKADFAKRMWEHYAGKYSWLCWLIASIEQSKFTEHGYYAHRDPSTIYVKYGDDREFIAAFTGGVCHKDRHGAVWTDMIESEKECVKYAEASHKNALTYHDYFYKVKKDSIIGRAKETLFFMMTAGYEVAYGNCPCMGGHGGYIYDIRKKLWEYYQEDDFYLVCKEAYLYYVFEK